MNDIAVCLCGYVKFRTAEQFINCFHIFFCRILLPFVFVNTRMSLLILRASNVIGLISTDSLALPGMWAQNTLNTLYRRAWTATEHNNCIYCPEHGLLLNKKQYSNPKYRNQGANVRL